jgi:hypothetical protein
MAAILLAWPAQAQQTRQLAPGAQPAAATLGDFAWMAGRWTGDGLGAKLEEVYSPAAGGVMLGHFQATDERGAAFFELITFRQERGTVMLRLRHFDPDLHAWEEKERTVEFPLVAIDRNRFYFSGLTIERVSKDEVRHFILLKKDDGTLAEMQTHYRRVR